MLTPYINVSRLVCTENLNFDWSDLDRFLLVSVASELHHFSI